MIPWITRLKHHCVVGSDDCNEINDWKTSTLAYIQEKFNPNILHKAAVLLNLRQKVLFAADRTAVMEYVNDQLEQQPLLPPPVSSNEPAAKRQNVYQVDEFSDDPDDNAVESELTQYMNTFDAPQTCPD